MENRDENEGFLKDRFEDFGAIPSPFVWEDIEKELHPKKRKKRFFWLWSVTTVFIVLGAFYVLDSTKNEKHETTYRQKHKKEILAGQEKIANKEAGKRLSDSDKIHLKAIKGNKNQVIFSENKQRRLVKLPIEYAKEKKFSNAADQELINGNKPQRDEKFSEEFSFCMKTRDFTPFHLKKTLCTAYDYASVQRGFSLEIAGAYNYTLFDQVRSNQYGLGIGGSYFGNRHSAIELGIMWIHNEMYKGEKSAIYEFNRDELLVFPIKYKRVLLDNSKYMLDVFSGLKYQYLLQSYQKSETEAAFFITSADYSPIKYSNPIENTDFWEKSSLMAIAGLSTHFKFNSTYALRLSAYYEYNVKKCERYSYITDGSRHIVGVQLGLEWMKWNVKNRK